MELKQYARVLRAHWVLIVATLLLVTAVAGIYAGTREPVYAAHTQLFVSARSDPATLTPSEVYQGGLASQARAESYARIVGSPPVAQAVVESLGLDEGTDYVQDAITATVPEETVLIDVTVRDSSPELAKEMADVVAVEFPRFVSELEGGPADPEGAPGEGSPVAVTVTSPAGLPESPESPGTALFLIGGAMLGLMIGVGLAVGREVLDRRVRDDEVAEAIAEAPVAGRIPRDPKAKKRPLVVLDDPQSPAAEAFRRLRANLRVATIDRDLHSLLVTSAVAGEGKTLIAANLAIAFARAGHHVVLVDADMRRRQLGRLLGLDPIPGLSDLLMGHLSEAEAEALHQEHELPLEVMTSGTRTANPSELLESDEFTAVLERLSRRAELVILDSPALLPVSDAAVMARSAAATLMVARAATTRAEHLDAAADFLRAIGKPPIAAVLNDVPARSGRDYGYGRSDELAPAAPTAPVWDS